MIVFPIGVRGGFFLAVKSLNSILNVASTITAASGASGLDMYCFHEDDNALLAFVPNLDRIEKITEDARQNLTPVLVPYGCDTIEASYCLTEVRGGHLCTSQAPFSTRAIKTI